VGYKDISHATAGLMMSGASEIGMQKTSSFGM
jgi:hypothetical protein